MFGSGIIKWAWKLKIEIILPFMDIVKSSDTCRLFVDTESFSA